MSASSAEPTMTLVLIQLPGPTEKNLFEELASRGSEPSDLPITMLSPDPLPAIDVSNVDRGGDQNSEAPVTSGDPAARALLFGRYSGQIDARIERAWQRPRSPVNGVAPSGLLQVSANDVAISAAHDELFHCQVRILQDVRGNVKETELLDCNGTVAWQRSLINAIQQASPLPAPPSPTVFTNAITLSFEAHAYRPGSSEDEYEIEINRTAQALMGDERLRAISSGFNNDIVEKPQPMDAPPVPSPDP